MAKRQLRVGDTVKVHGISATIASITFQEPWEWRNAWYLEFTDTKGNYINWKQNCDGGTAYDENGNEITDDTTATNNTNTNKEDNTMKNEKTNGQAQVMQIEVNGVKYTTTRPNYYYKNENGKQTRISKAEWEQVFEEYTQTASDNAEQDAWQAEADEMIEKMEQKQAESDKQAEDAMNKVHIPEKALQANKKYTEKQAKKAKAPRKSKDIAYEGNGVTLTEKQVDFIKHLPDTNFYENGLDSALWCDILAEEIGGQFANKPMTVGAMISTLREKSLVAVGQDRVNGRKCKFMEFTELGKKVAAELGLN